MMGQQETVAGSALRRILLALAVAVLMAAIMTVSALPALADGGGEPHKIPFKETGDGSKDIGANVLHCGTDAGGGINVQTAEASGPKGPHISCQ